MKCIVVDDDRSSLKLMENYILKTASLELVDTFENGIEASNFLRNNPIDLIFLDIEMPEMSGLDLAETLSDDTQIVFMSSQKEYAIQAFEIDVTDYILKPIGYKRFLDAVNKVQKSQADASSSVSNSSDHIFIKTDHQLLKVKFDDIKWVEAMSDYVMIYTKQGRHLVLSSLKSLIEKLPPERFVRTHRSFIVNMDMVQSVDDSTIVLGEKMIPLGKTYKSKFLKSINTI